MKKISIGLAFLAVAATGWFYAAKREKSEETYDLFKQVYTSEEEEEGPGTSAMFPGTSVSMSAPFGSMQLLVPVQS